MADRPEDYEAVLHRAKTVFRNQPFTAVQLIVETKRKGEAVREALEAFVAAGQVERVEGFPVTFKIKGES